MHRKVLFTALSTLLLSTGYAAPAIASQPLLAVAPPVRFDNAMETHWLANATFNGEVVEIEDGSHWKVASEDLYKIYSWRPNDPIAITPNHGWFSSYNYYLTNRATGAYVKANLFVGPVAYGPNTHWIVAIDRNTNQVFLENGSSWNLSSDDSRAFSDWAINDTIIVGINDTWFTSYNAILINVNMNNYVRGKRF